MKFSAVMQAVKIAEIPAILPDIQRAACIFDRIGKHFMPQADIVDTSDVMVVASFSAPFPVNGNVQIGQTPGIEVPQKLLKFGLQGRV